MPHIINNDIARFWSKVDKNGPTPQHKPELGRCWNWLSSLSPSGYARFRSRGQIFSNYAHVFSFVLHFGKVPTGKEIDHECRNRGCCNPSHLRPLTHRDNVLCGQTIPAHNLTKSECVRGHERTPENSYIDGQRKKQCRLCEAIRNRERGWKSGSATDGRVNSGIRELSEREVRTMHELFRAGWRYAAIAEKFSVSYSAAEKILRGARWPQIYREFQAAA